MQLIRGLHNLKPQHRGCVATIGNFDGVHLGHQNIVRQVRDKAAQLGVKACVIIFEPQPKEFFNPASAPARITRFREKIEALAHYGVDQVLVVPFNQQLQSLSAEQFIHHILVDGLGIRFLVIGDDFRFGCDRQGDYQRLQNAGRTYGFGVAATETVHLQQQRVSSTRVREALAKADFAEVKQLLGRPFVLTGKVVRGQQLGRTIGVPTANLNLKRCRPPMHGVYAVRARLEQNDGPALAGVANLGWRPTVAGEQPRLEVHLLDFTGDIYSRHLTVEFVARIRDEQKFNNLAELQSAIGQDIAVGRALLGLSDSL